ncbi:condensation domain-containing protein [Streptomyces sp. NPDC006798]|uniref:condensation domain-containing protein n=1 Tax=Streptomyces sp. NPDC006798 TaxID=3155462 RepID=UPI0033CB092E
MAESPTRCDVAFSGERSAAGPATCAQRHMWDLIRRRMPDSAFYHQLHWAKPSPGSSISDIRAVLGELVSRHESLRTVYGPGPDGGLRQRVRRSGSVPVDLLPVEGRAGPADAAGAVSAWEAGVRAAGFDHGCDPPFRAAIVCRDGEPVRTAFLVSHLAADLMALRVVEGEFVRLTADRAAGRTPAPPPPFRQPLDQAEFERSERGRRLLDRADRYWHDQLAALPPTMFPTPARSPTEPEPEPEPEAAGPPFPSTALLSRAVALALPVLAERYRSGSSAVLLAAVSLLLARRGGLPRCGLRLLVANRSDPASRGTVANLHLEVPVTVDVTGETFEDVVRSARVAALRAYANGLYDPGRAERAVREHERARGVPIDLSCCFNDARAVREDRPGPVPPTPAEIRAATAETTVGDGDLHEAERFFLVVHDDVPGRIQLVLGADPGVLPPAAVRAFLRAVERLLVDLAGDGPGRAERAGAAARGTPGRP